MQASLRVDHQYGLLQDVFYIGRLEEDAHTHTIHLWLIGSGVAKVMER